jgi:predicted nucleic acid-binding OB-fold protein|tara:strand:- start:666 stop:899 length:234 start_codon:yes stop_codon:yes gene_type:complete
MKGRQMPNTKTIEKVSILPKKPSELVMMYLNLYPDMTQEQRTTARLIVHDVVQSLEQHFDAAQAAAKKVNEKLPWLK